MEDIIVWTQDDCPLCGKVKKKLKGRGKIEERPAARLLGGEDKDHNAIVQLAMQNMQLPIVMIDGEYVDVNDVLKGE